MADSAAAEGRALTRTNLWRIFWISAVVSAVAAQEGANLQVWARLFFIGLACVLVYRGLRWALWLLGVLTVFAGLAMVFVAVMWQRLDWPNRVLLAAGGIVQVLAFVILLRAPEVRAFMDAQRARSGSGGPSSRA
jgi:cytochrome c oxidase subunit IV